MKRRSEFQRFSSKVLSWVVLLGTIRIPLEIIIASSLAQALSATVGGRHEMAITQVSIFSIATIVRLLFIIFEKTHVTLLHNEAHQSYRQELYDRFMKGNSDLHLSEPAAFTTIFRRDAQQIVNYMLETKPAIFLAAVGYAAYTLYICIALNGLWLSVCMLAFGLLNLLPPIILEKYLMKNFIAADKAESELAQHLTSGVEGFASLKMLQLHSWYMDKYRMKQRKYKKIGIRASAAGVVSGSMNRINGFLQTLGLVVILGWAMMQQQITFDAAMQIFILSTSVYANIVTLFQIRQNSAIYRAALGRVNEYLPLDEQPQNALPPSTALQAHIQVCGIRYNAAEKCLFEGVSFEVEPGEKCLVRGMNGAGKSTLLMLILGQKKPSEGQIRINGQIVSNVEHFSSLIAYCPQAAPPMRCTTNELFTYTTETKNEISMELLDEYRSKLFLSDNDMQKPMNELSGGNQKKVILCLALAKRAPLLLLDEPEAMLDQNTIEGLLDILRTQERTMLIISHNQLFDSLAHSYITFDRGQIYKTQAVDIACS